MADENDTTTPAPDAADRIAQLEATLASERAERTKLHERFEALDGTLKALGGRPAESDAGPTSFRLPRDSARRIAQATGWQEDDVHRHAPVIAAFFSEIAGPYLRGLDGLADGLDRVESRQVIPEYETLAEAIDAKRQEYVSRGQFISRKQAAALVKAERLQDPKTQDELLDRRLKQRQDEEARRAAEAAAGTTEGAASGSTQPAGPSAGKDRRPMTTSDFARLPPEKQADALGDFAL